MKLGPKIFSKFLVILEWGKFNQSKTFFSDSRFLCNNFGQIGLRVVITFFFLDVEVNPLNEIEIWKNAFKYKYSSWSKSRLLEFLSWHTACPGNCSYFKIFKKNIFKNNISYFFLIGDVSVHFRIIYRMEKGICHR